jgi:predicted DsbA family dithiol-disulfide isomerase
MTIKTNAMLCDPETGVCEIPAKVVKPIRITYFTDPICSTCWCVEPQLRKLRLEYGDYFDIEYFMGGLLPSWEIYNSGGISKASDVAPHWDEMGAHYEMPIDGDVWLEDPLPSSYPPSVAFKAAQLQGEALALNFLRNIREKVFLEKKNITRWEHLAQAALETGLDVTQFKNDYEGRAQDLFQADLTFARQMGVRGFPTFFFTDAELNRLTVYGFRPYDFFEQTLLKLHPQASKKAIDPREVFQQYPSLTTKEFALLTERDFQAAEQELKNAFLQGKLQKLSSKNGNLWREI